MAKLPGVCPTAPMARLGFDAAAIDPVWGFIAEAVELNPITASPLSSVVAAIELTIQ
jgi:hypothetical protein